METLRIIEHGNGHTDIEALIFGEWVVVKCIEDKTTNQEQNMKKNIRVHICMGRCGAEKKLDANKIHYCACNPSAKFKMIVKSDAETIGKILKGLAKG